MTDRVASRSKDRLLRVVTLGVLATAGLGQSTGCGDDSGGFECEAQCSEEISVEGPFVPPASGGALSVDLCILDACEHAQLEPADGTGASVSGSGAGTPEYYGGASDLRCNVENGRLRVWLVRLRVGGHDVAVGDIVTVRVTVVGEEERLVDAVVPVQEIGTNELCGTTCDAVHLTWD